MKRVSAMLGALALSGLLLGNAVAQDKKADKKAAKEVAIKVIHDDAKVRVFEATYAPGAENPSPPNSATRIVRTLSGSGPFERRYADGKVEKVDRKPGQVEVLQPGGAYTTKWLGKGPLVLYVIAVK